jgi:hypothetical protein
MNRSEFTGGGFVHLSRDYIKPPLTYFLGIHTICERGNGRGNYSELQTGQSPLLRGYVFVI